MIGGFRSPLFRWVLVFREVWFQVVRSVVSSIDALSGWTTRTGLHRTIAKPLFMIGLITTTAILLLSVISDKVLCVKYLLAVPLQYVRHELDVWPWSPISPLIKYIKILRTSDWPEGENFSSNTSAKSQHECKVVTRAVKTIRPLRLLKCEVHFFQDRCFFFIPFWFRQTFSSSKWRVNITLFGKQWSLERKSPHQSSIPLFKTRAAERILINTNLTTKYLFSRIIYPATTITQFYKSNTYISYPRALFYQRTA